MPQRSHWVLSYVDETLSNRLVSQVGYCLYLGNNELDAQVCFVRQWVKVLTYAKIRRLFSWKNSGWVPEFAAGTLGFGMIELHHFWVAYILIAFAGLWLIAWWECSDFLYKQTLNRQKAKARIKANKPDTAQRYRHELKKELVYRSGGVVVGVAVLVAALGYVDWEETAFELQQTIGILTPADDPMPPNPCRPMPSAPTLSSMRVYSAGGMSWSDKSRIVLVQIGNQDMLSITREGRQISVSGDIYTPDGDAVHIEGNSFETPQNGAFRPKRPDRHTLKVFDKWHQEVLNIRFLNDHAIRVQGIFWKPGRLFPLVIDGEAVKFGSASFGHPCNANTDIIIGVG
ncbi:MAG: hypothetical protein WCA10_01280 [Terracidiphilus sp.]